MHNFKFDASHVRQSELHLSVAADTIMEKVLVS